MPPIRSYLWRKLRSNCASTESARRKEPLELPDLENQPISPTSPIAQEEDYEIPHSEASNSSCSAISTWRLSNHSSLISPSSVSVNTELSDYSVDGNDSCEMMVESSETEVESTLSPIATSSEFSFEVVSDHYDVHFVGRHIGNADNDDCDNNVDIKECADSRPNDESSTLSSNVEAACNLDDTPSENVYEISCKDDASKCSRPNMSSAVNSSVKNAANFDDISEGFNEVTDYRASSTDTSSCDNFQRNSDNESDDVPETTEQTVSNLDDPLYEGAQISKSESLLLIMAHFLRFGLTQEALGSLLKLISFHMPVGTSFPISKYLFNQHFEGLSATPELHAYCSACSGYVGTKTTTCVECGTLINKDESISKGNYYIIFSISDQIKCLLEDSSIQSKILKDNSEFRKGQCYKELPMSEDDISLTWGSDGAAIFTSSGFSIWPVTLMINELPYAIRRKHVLMGGLWFGNGKPNFATFLKPLVKQLNLLSCDGLMWTNKDKHLVKSKIFPGPLSCDSMARCQLQGLVQFNGKYGCAWCLNPGEQVPKGGGHTNAYSSNQLPLPKQRDKSSYIKDAELAVQTNSTVHGVKKPSMILLLLHFNIISGFVVDYMHCVCIGVVKTMTYLWLENVNARYYIGNQLTTLNNKLTQIRPPSEVSRLCRSLTQRKFWKAHEWRAWLLHYSPLVLKHVLPSTHYTHWLYLVSAMYMLLDDDVSIDMINNSELLLMKFVLDAEEIYGKEYITYNMHLLTHMADSVRNWGPLWSISCFAFESMNHKLGKMISGTQHIEKQIAHKFLLCRTLPHIAINSFQGNFYIKDYFVKTLNHFPLSKFIEKEESGVLLRGAPKLFKLTDNEMYLLHDMGYTNNIALGYDKVSFAGIKITTDKHVHKLRKRNDCYVFLKDKTVAIVKKCFLVCVSCNQIKLCGCDKKCLLYLSILKTKRTDISLEVLGKKIYHEGIVKTNGHKEYRLCSINEFDHKCLVLSDKLVSILPNNVEFD
ncbi:uncharacterized protein LOC117121027 [Anneissia japonica]|uniref:uncharacterized protein LOC117121027 n=1 Tax=Anneissia japonica TaxID=1529436 RepID=UPI0014258F1F|nr:uncharacterized protein LOC117121027 [Anneissia japonica]